MDNFYTFRLDKWQLALVASLFCLALFTMGIGGYLMHDGDSDTAHYAQALNNWEKGIVDQSADIARVRQQVSTQLEVLAKQVVEMHAQLYHMDGVSQRLVQAAKLNPRELAAYNTPLYQPWNNGIDIPSPANATDFIVSLEKLESRIVTRAEQLAILERLLLQREATESMMGLGRIVEAGMISSPYGYRTDPITQQQAWHDGLDITGQPGSPIKAIAAGIVRFSGRRAGFGNLVEIDHGNGFMTRYAHNRNNLVIMGDIVNQGQMIAQMGSSGRATGPHVHFEVLHNGANLNPLPYLQAGYTTRQTSLRTP